jgi:PAS domain S-box-containing protein
MTPARILIVEDNRVVARDIRGQLSKIGHTVVGMTARSEDAVQLALSTRPEIVLMDIRLEGSLDGIGAAQGIRAHCNIPVIFLTAYADDETVQRAGLTEPFGYLLKPFEELELRTVIEMALYKHAAERKLRESERRFVATLSSIGDAVIATDKETRVTFMNPVAEALTGWPQREALGRSLAEIFHIVNEETRQMVRDPAGQVLSLSTSPGLANHTLLLARDGRELPIDDCGAPIIDDGGGITGAVLVFRDVSHRRQMEETLRKAQADLAHAARLTTMGELAVSVAHEVNQPLMAIVTNAEACLLWLAKDQPDLDEARKAAERVVKNGHRAGDVLNSIRSLVRKSSRELTKLDINAAIMEILGLMRSELRRQEISIEIELSADARVVVGDRVQLQQVILNLIMNAIEGMSATACQPRVLNLSSQNDQTGYTLISIADTGVGFDPTVSDRIFEPFFSTKPEGIGMGLSICRSIVDAHGGRLWASPNSPYGSIFCFTVPRPANGTSFDPAA